MMQFYYERGTLALPPPPEVQHPLPHYPPAGGVIIVEQPGSPCASPPSPMSGTMDPKGQEAPTTLAMRLLMQGKEVGSIIGKKGEIVKRFREESGAKINISDGSCPDRVVTVTGSCDAIFSAFKLICRQVEEFLNQMYQNNGTVGGGASGTRPPITLRLIVPASQCGSIIGKSGAKIKEIREITGASIQVASDMLPNSTERAVTVSGTADSLAQCVYHIGIVMLESPPKGATIPYRPKPVPAGGPVILAGGQAYTIQGNYAVPSAPDMSKLSNSPLSGLLGLGSLMGVAPMAPSSTDALAALAGSQLRSPMGPNSNSQTHEMTVPNELIGCIIGKGGTKIAEIRQITGAMITISKYDDGSEDASKQDRTIIIKGNADQVALAQYLINTSMELHKAQMDVSKGAMPTSGVNPNTIPIAQLLKNPQALNALSSLTGLPSLSSLTSLLGPNSENLSAAMNAHRQKVFQPKIRPSAPSNPPLSPQHHGGPSGSPNSASQSTSGSSPKENKRSKFAPY